MVVQVNPVTFRSLGSQTHFEGLGTTGRAPVQIRRNNSRLSDGHMTALSESAE
jgi:hypothetical protein